MLELLWKSMSTSDSQTTKIPYQMLESVRQSIIRVGFRHWNGEIEHLEYLQESRICFVS